MTIQAEWKVDGDGAAADADDCGDDSTVSLRRPIDADDFDRDVRDRPGFVPPSSSVFQFTPGFLEMVLEDNVRSSETVQA